MISERLLRLADGLDKIPPERFNFSIICAASDIHDTMHPDSLLTDCGSIGCAMGWAPNILPDLIKAELIDGEVLFTVNEFNHLDYVEAAKHLFSLSGSEVMTLFTPNYRGRMQTSLPNEATPTQVADHIRNFINSKENQ